MFSRAAQLLVGLCIVVAPLALASTRIRGAGQPDSALLQTGESLALPPSSGGSCEMCVHAVHQSQYGRLPNCGGGNAGQYYSSAQVRLLRLHGRLVPPPPPDDARAQCVQVVRSLIHYARDVMTLIKQGCYRYDRATGWSTEKPCSAHAICGRVFNIYSPRREHLCPEDPYYRYPHIVSEVAPKVYNPILPYAIAIYQNANASSVRQDAGSWQPR